MYFKGSLKIPSLKNILFKNIQRAILFSVALLFSCNITIFFREKDWGGEVLFWMNFGRNRGKNMEKRAKNGVFQKKMHFFEKKVAEKFAQSKNVCYLCIAIER